MFIVLLTLHNNIRDKYCSLSFQKGKPRLREGCKIDWRWWLVELGFTPQPFDCRDPCFYYHLQIFTWAHSSCFYLCLSHLSHEIPGRLVVSLFILLCQIAVAINEQINFYWHYLLGEKNSQASCNSPRYLNQNEFSPVAGCKYSTGHVGGVKGFEGPVQVVAFCHFLAILLSTWIGW